MQAIILSIGDELVLGQTVDAYGHDLPDGTDLADILPRLEQVDGIARVRY